MHSKCDKVLFVSDDDTYRAPIAAALFNKYAKGLRVKAESRGNVVLFSEPANTKGINILLEKYGLDISKHTSQRLKTSDFKDRTIMIMMTEQNKREAYNKFSNAEHVYTFHEFVGMGGDIEVPFGKGIEEYSENIEIIKERVLKAIDIIKYTY